MDVFKDRLSQRALDTSRPALAHQCQGRPLSPAEIALKDALMEVFATGTHDFAQVAAELASRRVAAPVSGRSDWTEALLLEELSAINADLDAAYRDRGYGA